MKTRNPTKMPGYLFWFKKKEGGGSRAIAFSVYRNNSDSAADLCDADDTQHLKIYLCNIKRWMGGELWTRKPFKSNPQCKHLILLKPFSKLVSFFSLQIYLY